VERNHAPQATSAEASTCGLSLVQAAQGRTTPEVASSQGPQGAASTRGAGVRFGSEFYRISPSIAVRHNDAPHGWSHIWSHVLVNAANPSDITSSSALRGSPWAQGLAGSKSSRPDHFSREFRGPAGFHPFRAIGRHPAPFQFTDDSRSIPTLKRPIGTPRP
jgi:hypothetical protein